MTERLLLEIEKHSYMYWEDHSRPFPPGNKVLIISPTASLRTEKQGGLKLKQLKTTTDQNVNKNEQILQKPLTKDLLEDE